MTCVGMLVSLLALVDPGLQAAAPTQTEPSVVSAPGTPIANPPRFTPPVAISQAMPAWRPPTSAPGKYAYAGAVKVMIDANGNVTSAGMQKKIHPFYDREVLTAARRWRYKPAIRDGVPVSSEVIVEVKLKPR